MKQKKDILLISKGAVIKYHGMPFKLEHAILVRGRLANMNVANVNVQIYAPLSANTELNDKQFHHPVKVKGRV